MRHDFTRSSWGNSIEARMNERDLLEGFAWSTPALRLGDEILYKTAYGTAVAQVIEIHNYRDPSDMSRFEAEIIQRNISEKVQAMIDSGEVDSPPWL